jgi:hypothetical protein
MQGSDKIFAGYVPTGLYPYQPRWMYAFKDSSDIYFCTSTKLGAGDVLFLVQRNTGRNAIIVSLIYGGKKYELASYQSPY